MKKSECGKRLKVRIHILFYGDNSRIAALTQTRFNKVKDHGHTYELMNHYFILRSS